MTDRHGVKVLVVDDSPYNRQTIRHILESDERIRVVGVASNGRDAIGRIQRCRPDVITLDIHMPVMDGFEVLRWLMANNPIPVIMVSSIADRATVFRALEMGAVDFVPKPTRRPTPELKGMEVDLLEKVLMVSGLAMEKVLKRGAKKAPAAPAKVRAPVPRRKIRLVAIGASTGGPTALQTVLTALPENLDAGVVISQHMPTGFTRPFAERLDGLSRLSVTELRGVETIEPGTALVAAGGSNLEVVLVDGRPHARSVAPAQTDRYVPSVNVMLTSAARVFGPGTLGIVLTGMGSDGKKGMLEIKARGGYTIAESEETAVVFGMPREAINAGAAEKILPVEAVGDEIRRLCGTIRHGGTIRHD